MISSNTANRLKGADLRVDAGQRPGWVRASEQVPTAGDSVYCSGGAGTVVSVHGRTGDGSRLLHIKLQGDEKTPPFFAAASNVLIEPRAG